MGAGSLDVRENSPQNPNSRRAIRTDEGLGKVRIELKG